MGRGGQGRPAKPTALKIVEGTRKDRVNRSEPRPAEVPIEPPAWLTGEVALAEWARLGPDLIDKGLLTGWDVQAFGEYCQAVADIAEATRHLAEAGHVTTAEVFDRNGKMTGVRTVRNEWSRVLKDAMSMTASRASRFGLTPSDRAGLSVPGGGESDARDPARLLS